MAFDPADRVEYFMSVAAGQRNLLGSIRHWSNLELAAGDGLIWIKGFTPQQLEAVEVKSIPSKRLYHALNQQLFPAGSFLPAGTIPGLPWTPIEQGLPVRLPRFNHNYFGLAEKVPYRLVASDREQEAFAMRVDIHALGLYLESAPAIRSKNLIWAMADEQAIIFGTPLLPLQGETFWQQGDFIFPTGYAPDLAILSVTLNDLLNPERTHWIIWNLNGTYWKLARHLLKPLSVGSFRLTMSEPGLV